ncbi:hypothetical protein N7541_001115 [Penicillium brevicompactum]|uniref:Uncharacterized protein n=1 Tax=Penicillium brevicompactum TaxID=5074 RepID=A0A9W9RY39_PENBR|nr:hypothetical protein N7541_001115 [Penicillium brevicompactum]
MPSNKSFPAILHVRDFIENVEPDPTRPGKGLSIQLRVSLNIPSQDIQSDDVEQHEIPTLIRFFNEGNRPDLYQPNAFVYSSGSFLTTSSDDEGFHIVLHAHNLDCHPGNQEDTASYFMHCPGAAQPIVTFLGVVLERGGQLNDGPTLLHYRLQTTVYNTSTRTHHTFPITAYFKNGQRWANFPPLNANAHVFLTGRIFGLTKESCQLAIITDDIHFLPASTHHHPPTPSSTTGKRKRVDRWSQRAGPTTPTKSDATPRNESSLNDQQYSEPTVTNTQGDGDEESTQITWPDTPDETNTLPRSSTPTPERRSQRPRKTSYADILAQSKYSN